MKTLIASLLLFQSLNAFADCKPGRERKTVGNTTVEYMFFEESGKCFVTLDSNLSSDLIFRSYLFSSDGTFMIFDSYGEGDEATTTGSRVLYTFPNTQAPSFEVAADESEIYIFSSSGKKFTFDPTISTLMSIDGVKFIKNPKISPDSNGGIEILGSQDLLLDLGFRLGENAKVDSWRSSKFILDGKPECTVKNSEIFEYRPGDPYWEIPFRYERNEDLQQFLSQRCGY